MYLDPPRGAQWMVRGAMRQPLRVQTPPLGGCWYLFVAFEKVFLCIYIWYSMSFVAERDHVFPLVSRFFSFCRFAFSRTKMESCRRSNLPSTSCWTEQPDPRSKAQRATQGTPWPVWPGEVGSVRSDLEWWMMCCFFCEVFVATSFFATFQMKRLVQKKCVQCAQWSDVAHCISLHTWLADCTEDYGSAYDSIDDHQLLVPGPEVEPLGRSRDFSRAKTFQKCSYIFMIIPWYFIPDFDMIYIVFNEDSSPLAVAFIFDCDPGVIRQRCSKLVSFSQDMAPMERRRWQRCDAAQRQCHDKLA